MEITRKSAEFALPVRTILKDRYQVMKVLGMGGFGVTYMVTDIFTNKIFAMKEYAPARLCVRDSDHVTIKPIPGEKIGALEHGRVRFLEEADLLRQLDTIAGMVPVMDCFNQNRTSYFVMEYLDGVTLKQYLKQHNGRLGIGETLSIIGSVAYALDRVHAYAGVLHRDVTPDNIFILKDHSVRIIDFGNAKYLVSSEESNYSVILKPGFAPLEQYSFKSKQGTYTDVYSLAGTMYYCLTGMMIPSAPERLNGEEYISLKGIFPEITQAFSNAVDQALTLEYSKRTSTMVAFMHNLGLDPTLYEDTISLVPYLEMISGRNVGRRYKILKDTYITIGRSRNCDITFQDNLYISKKHCEVYYDSEKEVFYIEDYSTNGTFVEEQRLIQKKLVKLDINQQFAIGDKNTVLKVGVMHV